MKFKDWLSIRRYDVAGTKLDGTEPALVLQTSNEGMVLFEFEGLKRKVLHSFIDPAAEVVKKRGSGRYLFKSGIKPKWVVSVFDWGCGQKYDMVCRSEGEARTIARWCNDRRQDRVLEQ